MSGHENRGVNMGYIQKGAPRGKKSLTIQLKETLQDHRKILLEHGGTFFVALSYQVRCFPLAS